MINSKCDACTLFRTTCLFNSSEGCMECINRHSTCTFNGLSYSSINNTTTQGINQSNISLNKSPTQCIGVQEFTNSSIMNPRSMSPDRASALPNNPSSPGEAEIDDSELFKFDFNSLIQTIPKISLIPKISSIHEQQFSGRRNLLLEILNLYLYQLEADVLISSEQSLLIYDFFKNHGDPNVPLEKFLMAINQISKESIIFALLINSICTSDFCRTNTVDRLSYLTLYYEKTVEILGKVEQNPHLDKSSNLIYEWSKWLLSGVSLVLKGEAPFY